PALVPWIAIHFGWRASFVVLGASGLLWMVFWHILYDRPERSRFVSPAELTHIGSSDLVTDLGVQPKVPWASLFGYRQTWAYVIPSMFVNPIWRFYLFWLP